MKRDASRDVRSGFRGRIWVLGLTAFCSLMAAGGGNRRAAAPEISRSKGVEESSRPVDSIRVEEMSGMGRKAYLASRARGNQPAAGPGRPLALSDGRGADFRNNLIGIAGGQAELSLAVDATGLHVVVGFNDNNGFALNPVSVSGYAYSDDGGATFTYGGLLPTPGDDTFSGQRYPQVYGDPDVKYIPGGNGCQFIYSSILVKRFPASGTITGTAQTMGFHRSTDCGHTWSGPYEVLPATNPTGAASGGNARDSADKEFTDVDPETGRVLMSWSNFTSTSVIPGGVEISTSFCDDIMSGEPPSWAARSVLNPGSSAADQASVPRFAAGSSRGYVTWRRTTNSGKAGNIGFSYSSDEGATWSAAVDLTANFFPEDYVLGNDRINHNPSMAVDQSPGPFNGNIYLSYVNNNNRDGADIAFQKSADGGKTFSAPVLLNSRPGADRSQWFPWVSVDKDTGRVSVFYYDQGVAESGDRTEVTWIYSDDGGSVWSRPAPLTVRPFHAGYGNDTSQPNLGDYNGGVSQGGYLYAAWAGNPDRLDFTEGQPNSRFTAPDFHFKKTNAARAALRLGEIQASDASANGYIDPGETVLLGLPLFSYVTNSGLGNVTYSGVHAALASLTAGVTVTSGYSDYGNLAPGESIGNSVPFRIQVSPSMAAGSWIDFRLSVASYQGNTDLEFSLPTGTPLTETVYAENFDGVAPGALPAGWSTVNAGGNNIVPWTTGSGFCSAGSNGLFHANANDGLQNNHTRWERALSPSIAIPGTSRFVTLEFDICYDTEDDPEFRILAYDGTVLRIADLTPGRTSRSILAEAFAEEIRTGSLFHYPKHLPRNSSTAYFQDMSAWAGDSGGFRHVSMQLPGMQGSTIQLRFEYTQDSNSTCADLRPGHACGVLVDNIVLKNTVALQPQLLFLPAVFRAEAGSAGAR